VDSGGKVFFVDICPEQIRKVSNGTITTVAGKGQLSPLNGHQSIIATYGGQSTQMGTLVTIPN
jgi:hypothetical protein